MGSVYLSQVNFLQHQNARQINFLPSITVQDYDNELSIAGGNNIYLSHTNQVYNFTTEGDDLFYLNANMCGFARGLIELRHTDALTKSITKINEVTNLHTAFANCYHLSGSPRCTDNIKCMYGAYYNGVRLTGEGIISANANNLIGTYFNCKNITSINCINTKATMMVETFYNCTNLSGNLYDADWAKSLKDCFYNCYLLEGNPCNCNSAFVTINAYYNCPNLYGTFYWQYNKVSQAELINATNMFYGRNYSNKLNMYVYNQSGILNALLNYGDSYGNIYGISTPLTWTRMQDQEGFNYYNNSATNTNIYITEDLSKFFEFDFTGTIQTFVVPTTGIYQFETWGAQGGSAHNNTTTTNGGFGAYSTGQMRLNRGDVLYITVGGQNGYGGGGSVGR